ncbi:hypothetical protein C8039_10015 [Halogeometricum sp. wsp3]|nr:hypothetical protein C8039_10015 [Halogeometricum sp. wsp3]
MPVGRACARSHAEDNPREWREEYRERQRDTIATSSKRTIRTHLMSSIASSDIRIRRPHSDR